ncbi:MAG TPA: hypothetical protein VMF30_11245 [Pirellulales bacterium]|nr:hypothetical protein [Pirellulales bacterium]
MPDDAPHSSADSPRSAVGRKAGPAAAALEDPVVRSGRREALWTLSLWLTAAIYSITWCTLFGYDRSVDSLTFVLWFPDWFFWGVVLPWGICTVVSIFFAFCLIQDDPLTSSWDTASEDTPPDDRTALEEEGSV